MNFKEAEKILSLEAAGRSGIKCHPVDWESPWMAEVFIHAALDGLEYQAFVYAPIDEHDQVICSPVTRSLEQLVAVVERMLAEPVWHSAPLNFRLADHDISQIEEIAAAAEPSLFDAAANLVRCRYEVCKHAVNHAALTALAVAPVLGRDIRE